MGDDRVDVDVARFPAEDAVRKRRFGDELRGVPRSPPFSDDFEIAARDTLAESITSCTLNPRPTPRLNARVSPPFTR